MSPLLLDVMFGTGVLGSLYFGYKRGLLRQVVGLVSSLVGLALAARFAADLVEAVDYRVVSKPVTTIIAFIVIFLVVLLLTRWIGRWLTDRIKETPVGVVNSVLGAFCGTGIFLVASALLMVVSIVVVPGARSTIEQTTVVKGVLIPVKAILDERLLRHEEESDIQPNTP